MSKRMFQIKILSLITLSGVHFVLFPFLFKAIEGAAYALSFFPVALAGVFFGMTGGILAGLIYTFMLLFLLLRTTGQSLNELSIFSHMTTFFVLSFVGGVVGRLHDLHELLRKSREHYVLLFSRMQTAFSLSELICDENGKPSDYRFISVNPAFEKLYNLNASEIAGKKGSEVCLQIEPYVMATYGRVALFEEVQIFEEFNTHLNKHLEIIAYCPQKGQFASLTNDVSARIKYAKEKNDMQAQLFHFEKLATIGTMAAGVAHEINNPLAIIKGYTEILTSRVNTQIPNDKYEKALSNIHNAISRIVTIVNSLRTYARADTDRIESVDINHTIIETVPLVLEIVKSKGIDIQQNLAPGIVLVQGNIGKMQQVIVNLLTNACDALQSRPSDRRIVIETSVDAETVNISVSDNGPGIPNKIFCKIFDPFFTTKEVGKGTGLGLSISNSIIESFGGSFGVSSKEGEGATFEIKLTRMHPQAVTGSDCSLEKNRPTMLHMRGDVLVIDDEPALCALLKHQLEETGLTVTAMTDPCTASEIMTQKKFDLIITDMQMPGITGIDLIKKVRKSELQIKTPIIVITGDLTSFSNKNDRAFLRETVQGYLDKPWETEQLLELVRSLLLS